MLILIILLLFSIPPALSPAAVAQQAGDPVVELIGIWRVPNEPTEIAIYDDHTVLHSRFGRGDIQHLNAYYFNINYRERSLICHYLVRLDSAIELSLIRQEHTDPGECDLGLMRRAPWREGVPGPVSLIWQQVKDSDDLGILESFRRQFGVRNAEYDGRAAERIAALKRASILSEAAKQWSIIQNTTSEAVLLGFIVRFGDTDYGRYARLRLDELKEERERNAPPPVPKASPANVYVPRVAPVPVTLLEKIAEEGRWAIGGASNCGIAKKTYTLELAGNQARWLDGLSNLYVEQIEFVSESEARTISRTGTQKGTVWRYSKIGADQVHVQPSGKAPFMLGRCG